MAKPNPDRNIRRTLREGDKGPDVAQLQVGINRIVDHYAFDWRKLVVDGNKQHGGIGQLTLSTAGLALFVSGATFSQIKKVRHGVMDQTIQHILRDPHPRNPAMEKRFNNRKDHIQELRSEHRKAVEAAKEKAQSCLVIFDGKACPRWIAVDLQKIRDLGWGGGLVSGQRTAAYSQSLCYGMCNQPSCPDTCAGTSSNHVCPPSFKCCEPEGAADLSDYITAARLFRQIGSKLHNSLPNDLVHFSASGN